jgi:hypothetical protein
VAYTEDLDRWEAAHYSSGTAPAFVLAQFLDIDGRNPVLAEPATWRAIMEHYRVVATTGSPTWIVLEKDPSAPPSSLSLGQVAPATARIGDVVPVPPAADLEYAHFRLVPTPVARVAAALYQIPPVYITLTYESGDVEVSRLLPDTTSNGIPLNIVPVDTADFLHLLQGRASDRVTAFRIAGPGAAFYLPNLSIRWEDSGHAVAYQPSRRVPIANLPSSRSNIAFAVDAVGDRTAPKSGSLIELSDDGTETVGISGWAVDPVAHRAAKAVYIDIDGTLDVPAHYGLERHDVAEYLGDPGDELSGFSAHLEDRLLVNGPHSITFKVLSDDGSHIYVPNYALRIDVR